MASTKLIFVANKELLDNGQKTQGAVLNDKGTLDLIWIKRDDNGIIRKVVNNSSKSEYPKVTLDDRNTDDLNLTRTESKLAMKAANDSATGTAIIKVYRSSGYKDEGKSLTREQQKDLDCARVIEVAVRRLSKGASVFAKDFECSVFSDTGASCELEGEYTL